MDNTFLNLQNQNQYSFQENQQAAPPRVEELQENVSIV